MVTGNGHVTQHVNDLDALSAIYGFPVTAFRLPRTPQVRALEGRSLRRWQRQQYRTRRKLYRKRYAWQDRHPNQARVLTWTLILAAVALFTKGGDMLAEVLRQHLTPN